jgi:hypothetical protein
MTIGVAQMDGAFTDAEESSPATKTLPSVRRETPSLAKQLSASISDGVSKARPDVELTFLGLEFGTGRSWTR